MEKTVLLTGGNGFIGGCISRFMNRQGLRSLHLSRNRPVEPDTAFGWVRGDVRDPEACLRATFGVDMVIHAAGEKNDPRRMHAVNVTGTVNLLDAAWQNKVKLFIHLSSVGVIGAHPLREKVYDEEATCRPESEYEQSKWLAEEKVREVSHKGLKCVILRPTNVFGDQDPARGLLSLTRSVRDGRFIFLGGRDAMCNFVYVEDVAHAVLALARSNGVPEGVYHLADPCSLGEFIDAIADELGVPRPTRAVPAFCASSLRMVLRCLHGSPLAERSAMYARLVSLNNRAKFVSERLYREIGFRNPVGWRRGVSRLIKWYRDQGDL